MHLRGVGPRAHVGENHNPLCRQAIQSCFCCVSPYINVCVYKYMFFSPPAPPPPKKQRTGLLGSARDPLPLPRHLLLETLRRVKMRSNPQKCSYVLNVYNSLRCSMSSFTHVYVRLNTPNPRVLGATMSPRGHHGVPHRSLRDSTRSLRVRRARGAVYSCRLPPCVQGSARARGL